MNYSKTKFEIVVRAIICDKEGRVLLVKRVKNPQQGKRSLPGGKVKFGEQSERAIIREIKEELNLTFKQKFLIFKDDYKSVTNTHCHVIYFRGSVQGKLKIKKEEIESVDYLTKEEILKSKDIGFDHQEVLRKLL